MELDARQSVQQHEEGGQNFGIIKINSKKEHVENTFG
jgi:hypothetical protein